MCAHERACDRRSSREARSSRLRRTSRGVGSILLLVTPMLFAACAKDSTKPGTYTLTGRVRLVGALRNAVIALARIGRAPLFPAMSCSVHLAAVMRPPRDP